MSAFPPAAHIGLLMPALDNPGGVTVFVREVADALRQRGHRVRLFAVGQSTTPPSDTDTFCINAPRRGQRLKQLKSCIRDAERDQPFQLLVSNNLQTAAFLRRVESRACKVFTLHQPSLLTPTGYLRQWQRRRRLRTLLQHQHVAAVSAAYLRELQHQYPDIRMLSARVIYNPIDPLRLNALAGAPSDDVPADYLLSVGRLTATKNHAALLHAYAALPATTPVLVILGEGPKKAQLQALAIKLGIASRVQWLAWKANPYPIIKHARLLIHTATAESFGRVLAEALALGTPVTAFDCPYGPAEILTGELARFLVPNGDLKRLCESITLALKHYPPLPVGLLASFAAATTAAAYEDYL